MESLNVTLAGKLHVGPPFCNTRKLQHVSRRLRPRCEMQLKNLVPAKRASTELSGVSHDAYGLSAWPQPLIIFCIAENVPPPPMPDILNLADKNLPRRKVGK